MSARERSMRLAFFNEDPGSGGGIANVDLMLRTLMATYPDDRWTIVCPQTSLLTGLAASGRCEVVTHPVDALREARRLYYGLLGLGRILRARSAELLWSMNVGPLVRMGLPQLLSVHNSYQVYPWEAMRHHPGSGGRVAALRWLFRVSLRASDGVVVQTPLMADYIRRIRGAPARIAVLPKAVESAEEVLPEPLPPALREALETRRAERPFTLLYVSTGAPHKNHAVLVKALRVLAQQGRAVRLAVTLRAEEALALGGDGARRLLDDGVLLALGWVGKAHLRALYDACDACVMPSLLESLSSAYLEAMMWSRPQLVADLAFARDICGDAADYAAPQDPGDWARKVERLRVDGAHREALVARGHERVRAFPATWVEAARRLREVFEAMLEGGSGARAW